MGCIPTMEQAQKLLEEYNQDEFHLKHAKIVSGVMGYFAKEYDGENVEFWKVVGLLHDLDFERYPEQHCVKSQEIMREKGLDERIIRAPASHGYQIRVDIKPEHIMEKILYATDELTGLIGAEGSIQPVPESAIAAVACRMAYSSSGELSSCSGVSACSTFRAI